ncbi:MAG: beta-ketoacyl-ACP synthase III [Kofleriaceae bacterium]|nr:beta-ketoacyl-ACP synthase III [Myxococcales bacterium]MCB9563576.1 beta-ketoacyl-ACP synthase III [Kofleriaceae bacterium]
MEPIVITGTGLYTPAQSISNDELVASFNAYVDAYNASHAAAIAAGTVEALQASSAEFIVKASGIERRHVVDKAGVLDPEIMAPRLRERRDDEPSIMCEMAVAAATEALAAAQVEASDIDCVLVGCSNMERAYPALAIEVQAALGARGYGYDLNVACSSATFAIQAAVGAIRSGSATRVLVVNPEICSGHLNFRDRDSHFIFGDACTAIIVEPASTARHDRGFEIVGIKVATQFSNNIRNNFGYLNRARPDSVGAADKLFVQAGRKVFKEVCPMVADLILAHLDELHLRPDDLRRMFLHQANLAMNRLIGKRVLGREPSNEEAPTILDEYANTSSAGSIIAFHKHQAGLAAGDLALICSFGAGYSVGNVVVRAR